MALETEAKDNDLVLECGDVKVFVDRFSAQRLAGTTVDFLGGMEGSGFKFDNPNATSSCPPELAQKWERRRLAGNAKATEPGSWRVVPRPARRRRSKAQAGETSAVQGLGRRDAGGPNIRATQ